MKVYKENGERKVWLTSDLHLSHDRDFIWEPRGFKSVDEMNKAIVANWNRVVGPADWATLCSMMMKRECFC